jgi:hypothetical protein
MAGYFDMLRDPDENYQGQLDTANYNADVTKNYNSQIADIPPQVAQSPEENALYKQAGYIPGAEPNTWVTPMRGSLQKMQQREQQIQLARDAAYEKTHGSTLFKIGDSLADAGRFFMSPLFWLSGEDTTKYDPSAVLETGYRKQFDASIAYREGLYQKQLKSRDARDLYRNNLNTSNIQNQVQQYNATVPKSPQGQLVFDFARLNGRMDEFNSRDPLKLQQLTREARVNAGEGMFVGVDNRFMEKQTYVDMTEIGKTFQGISEDIGAAYMNYRQLIKALDAQTGIGDISAVFNYMKTLDPDSVVREGEFALAKDAAGLFQRLSNLAEEAKTGKGLTPKARSEMRNLATQLIHTYEDKYEDVREFHKGKIEYRKGTEEDVLNFLGDFKQLYPNATIESI